MSIFKLTSNWEIMDNPPGAIANLDATIIAECGSETFPIDFVGPESEIFEREVDGFCTLVNSNSNSDLEMEFLCTTTEEIQDCQADIFAMYVGVPAFTTVGLMFLVIATVAIAYKHFR